MGVKSLFMHNVIVQETLVPMNHILMVFLEEPLCSQTDWRMQRGQLWSGKSNSGSLLMMMMMLLMIILPMCSALHQEPNTDLSF